MNFLFLWVLTMIIGGAFFAGHEVALMDSSKAIRAAQEKLTQCHKVITRNQYER